MCVPYWKMSHQIMYPAWDIWFPYLMEVQEDLLQPSEWVEALEESSNDP